MNQKRNALSLKEFFLPMIIILLSGTLQVSCNVTPQSYIITYNSNAGTGTIPNPQTKMFRETLTIAPNSGNLQKVDYTFDGWNTESDGSGTFYATGSDYNLDESVTLYAQWSEIFSTTENEGKLEITAFHGTGTEVTIPQTINDKPVTSIGQNVFRDRTNITSITIPESVTSIGNFAFFRCSNLTSITIPEGVTLIGSHVFMLSGLTNITIPSSVITLNSCAFNECGNLAEISILGATSIGTNAFWNCVGLTTVSMPNIISLGDKAFDHCTSLESILIPDSVLTVGSYIFCAASSLTDINCESDSKPSNWDQYWNSGYDTITHWGQ